MIKIGQSVDIHQLVEGRDLILGGVKIPHTKGLLGHSDADVLTHAIAESIIGALGMGDLGTFFPDTDPKYKGANSLFLLSEVVEVMEQKGYKIGNVDSLIMAERPKIKPHVNIMRQNIAKVLKTNNENVNIKATRGEKLGFIGREEGMKAHAVTLLVKDPKSMMPL